MGSGIPRSANPPKVRAYCDRELMELRPSLRVLVLFPASSLAESMSDTESCDEGTARISSGIVGLDDILCGGLDRDRLYLIEGTPGTGKTTLALQFLLEGSPVHPGL